MKNNNKSLNKDMNQIDKDRLLLHMINSPAYRYGGGCMVVADIISNAQSQIDSNNLEEATKTLNWAKSILFDIKNGRLLGTHKRLSVNL